MHRTNISMIAELTTHSSDDYICRNYSGIFRNYFGKNCRNLSGFFTKYISLLIIVSAFMSSEAMSQTSGGGYSQSYLLRPTGTRQISMAGANTAVANDPYCLFYNPAGLSFTEDTPTVSLSHSMMQFSRTHSTLVWGQSMFDNFGFGFGINNFTSGSFIGRDIMGHSLGTYTDWQFAAVAGAAYKMDFASVGVSMKYLENTLQGAGFGASGYALDIGTKFDIMDLFTFGLAAQNVSAMMFWDTEDETIDLLPFTIRTGVAMEFGLNDEEYVTRSTINGELETISMPATKYILISLDAVLTQHENAPSVVLGAEVVPHDIFAVRGGIALFGDNMNKYEFLPMTVWGFGFSIRPRKEDINLDLPFKFQFDYSISADQLSGIGIAHHISLIFEIDPIVSE